MPARIPGTRRRVAAIVDSAPSDPYNRHDPQGVTPAGSAPKADRPGQDEQGP